MVQGQPEILAERRASVLSQLVLLFAEGGDPVDLAENAVQMVARATDAAAAFVYLWDQEDERLVLRVGTPGPQSTGIGEVRLRMGEGITGWAALRQESVIINDAPRNDPRYLQSEKVEEAEFRSMLAVPIAEGKTQLRGVFSLYSTEEAAFGEDELAIALEVGRLLASGLVRAETVENLNRQSATARFLVEFPMASRMGLAPSLQLAGRKILDLMDAEVCVLEYMSRRESGSAPVVIASRVPRGEPRVLLTHSKEAARSTVEQHGTNLENVSVTLGMSASRGVLTCYRRFPFRSGDLDRLSNLTTQLSVLLEAVDSNSVGSSVVAQLLFSEHDADAARIVQGLGIEGPMFPVVIRLRKISGDPEQAARRLKEALAAAGGARSVVLLDSMYSIALVPVHGGRIPAESAAQLRSALQEIARGVGLSAAVGIGELAPTPQHALRALKQARLALEWAEYVNRAEPVALTAAAEIRDAQYLTEIVSELVPEVLIIVRTLEPLVEYDLSQGADLMKTLSVLASCGGSVQETVGRLVIHRNTLRQRMQRIEQVLGTQLDSSINWTAWSLAARIAERKIQQRRRQAPGTAPGA